MGTIAFLDVYTWQGISLGAEHYYGKLSICGQEKKLMHRLTTSGAAKLNKKLGEQAYHPGNRSDCFDTEEQVIELGSKMFRKCIDDGVLLIGRRSIVEPQRCVCFVGNYEEFFKQANQMFEEWEQVPWNEYDDDLTNRWDDLKSAFSLVK